MCKNSTCKSPVARGNDKIEAQRRLYCADKLDGAREVGMNQIVLCFADQAITFGLYVIVFGKPFMLEVRGITLTFYSCYSIYCYILFIHY